MMPKIQYEAISFKPWKMEIIDTANTIVAEYAEQGYTMTLRQVYYQFVARDLLPAKWADPATGSTNNARSYDNLGKLIADARKAGLIDWEAIVDRTREMGGNSHWRSPEQIIEAIAEQYAIDKWADQPYRPEIWVEKDALEGVVAKVCGELDVPYFSCRGYTSATAIWENGQRLKGIAQRGQTPIILHLGDHDPSGIDMSRDIDERAREYMDGMCDRLIFERIALNMGQVQQYRPPENPAKSTDSRFKAYRDAHGDKSWELDALDPNVIADLISDRVGHYRDDERFAAQQAREDTERQLLGRASDRWADVVKLVSVDGEAA